MKGNRPLLSYTKSVQEIHKENSTKTKIEIKEEISNKKIK